MSSLEESGLTRHLLQASMRDCTCGSGNGPSQAGQRRFELKRFWAHETCLRRTGWMCISRIHHNGGHQYVYTLQKMSGCDIFMWISVMAASKCQLNNNSRLQLVTMAFGSWMERIRRHERSLHLSSWSIFGQYTAAVATIPSDIGWKSRVCRNKDGECNSIPLN